MRQGRLAVVATVLTGLGAFVGLPASAVAQRPHREIRLPSTTERLGLQTVPKRGTAPKHGKGAAVTPNPMLAMLPDPSRVDMTYWSKKIAAKSRQRAAATTGRAGEANRARVAATAAPLTVVEQEKGLGQNDDLATAQAISRFGSGPGRMAAARIDGIIASPVVGTPFATAREDNGSIRTASETGVSEGSARTTSSVIGDGPHGSTGDGTGDFDFYAVRGATAGQHLTVDIDTDDDGFDSVVVLFDSAGTPIAANDDDDDDSDSLLTVALPADGDYFISVSGFGPGALPNDPFDSGSGGGSGSEGAYRVTFGYDVVDRDVYAVDLAAGDVLSGSLEGAASTLSVYDPAGHEVFGSSQDGSSLYPITSPLAGGGRAVVDHVAARSGRHYVAVDGPRGDYDITLEVYRPARAGTGPVQTVFLDFDGQRVNTAVFGGPGVRRLSPLSSFLPAWHLGAAQENALIDQVVATVTENLHRDFAGTGARIRVLDSRDDADPFGRPGVSRVIVGGTIAESGVNTIGISQSVDPGNFDTAETALVLLDLVSAGAEEPEVSFNAYLTPASNRVRFVGTALGNLVSHEAGHFLGNWHTDQTDATTNLMDRGGAFAALYGVGPDGVGGTSDDTDVDFGPDALNPGEGFTGTEDSGVRVRWGLTTRGLPVRPVR